MRIVVALGGNALGYDPITQKENTIIASKKIAYLIKEGHEVIITHGNGPQVGLINLAFTEAKACDKEFPLMGLCECGAMSQGYIGYHLQNSLRKVLTDENIITNVATVITQIVVNESDIAFSNPTKPIGKYYCQEEAKNLEVSNNYVMKDMGKKGFRRVVASPKPIDIIEKDTIETLVENKNIVICCGGGGIPVIKKNDQYIGVDAVIDKDYASSLLALKLKADMFIILTDIDEVYLNYGKTNQKSLRTISANEAYNYINEGYFGEGSMKPKVEAACNFTSSTLKKSLITSLNKLEDAFLGKTGTFIE